jgi:NAD(P)-dependent dehydrogenase (short-subunit alcohol dehydrogenase family)
MSSNQSPEAAKNGSAEPKSKTMKNDQTADDPKTAIVTGASSGIGLGIALSLLEQGYRVVANSRNISKSESLTGSQNLILVDGNIGEKSVAEKVVDAAIQQFGEVDLLVNNAGVLISKPFTDYTSEDLNVMLATNLAGFFFVSQLAIAQMRKQKSGHVVNITAALVDQPIAGVTSSLANLTKGGLQSITKALAIEYAAEGIRVNAIAPGVVNTPMHATENHEFLRTRNPMHHLGEVSDITDALLYLTAAAFVTGQTLYVDGGSHAGR